MRAVLWVFGMLFALSLTGCPPGERPPAGAPNAYDAPVGIPGEEAPPRPAEPEGEFGPGPGQDGGAGAG
jgi:hypothetical protein